VDADALPLGEALPAEAPPATAGEARSALNVAAPGGVAAGLAAPEPADAVAAGTAIIEIRVVADPGAAGGQDLVIDVTAAP
jgi:hypothetical protein